MNEGLLTGAPSPRVTKALLTVEGVVLFCLGLVLLVIGGLVGYGFWQETGWKWGTALFAGSFFGAIVCARLGYNRFYPSGKKPSWPVRIAVGLLGLFFLGMGILEVYLSIWGPTAFGETRATAGTMGLVTGLLGFRAVYHVFVHGEDPEMRQTEYGFVPATPSQTGTDSE